MADEANNDDQWLYGDSLADSQDANNEASEEKKLEKLTSGGDANTSEDQPPREENSAEAGAGSESNAADESRAADENDDKNEGEIDDDDNDDDDDSDDDVNVVIGDIKTTPATYSTLNIKRTGLLTSAGGIDKLQKQPGKFSIEEFEQIGTINGMPTHEYNLDSLEDKPWRKPGADITDYFNYGFNEETWRAYCERQKRMRVHESGVGLGPLAGPPPGRKMGGSIDVIGSGGGTLASRRHTDRDTPPKENVIQVMTADRREYSRKNPGFPDMSVPPPTGLPPTFDVPPPIPVPGPFPPQPRIHPPPAPYGQEQFYSSDTDPYYQSYEPTQEQQWMGHQDPFGPRDESHSGIPGPTSSSLKSKDDKDSPKSSRDRDRDRSERDKEKHRSHRHRSRSRSPTERKRRHKSRSRSPSHRSHRKKKSKKSDKSKEEESD